MTNNLLILAEKSAKSKDYETAIKYCNEFLSSFPADSKGLRLLAFIYSLTRDYSRATDVISHVIDLYEDRPEPCDYFNRGRWYLESYAYEAASADFLKIIELCICYKDDYYLESAYLFNAATLVEIKLNKKALDNLLNVSDECTGFAMGRIISKAELLKRLSKL